MSGGARGALPRRAGGENQPVGTGLVLGVDLGGTKCAAGLIDCATGAVLDKRLLATAAERGPEAVLGDVVRVIQELAERAESRGGSPAAVGIGIAELVDLHGRFASGFTIDWRTLDVALEVRRVTGLPLFCEADVRAAALAEAVWGAGVGHGDFLYVTIGTGISAAIVIGGVPYRGVRGLTGTIASAAGRAPDSSGRLVPSQPLERFAAGPAIARRYAAVAPGFIGDACDVVRFAEQGEAAAASVVGSAAVAIGAGVAALVNTLDPGAVVLGGGLGLVEGEFRRMLVGALREHIWSDLHREIPIVSASLGVDSGMIGAGLVAAQGVGHGEALA